MRFNKQLALRILSTAAFLSITASCAAPAFADAYGIAVYGTYYLEKGSITVEHKNGNNYVSQKDADGNYVRRDDGSLIDGTRSEKELAARKGETDTRTDDQIKEDEKLVISNNDGNDFNTSTKNTISINNDDETSKAKADTPTRVDEDTSAEITIKDINIDTTDTDKAGITVSGKGDTTIEIDNTHLADDSKNHNKVTGGGTHAGIEKTGEGMLVIRDDADQGNGYLDVKGGAEGGAGIGSAAGKDVDNIFINNARIDAEGGAAGGAGIGSGKGGNAKDITFGNGKLTGSGGEGGAALGSGANGDAENIRVGNGTFDISGGEGAAAIGSGVNGNARDITVDNGTFEVRGGSSTSGGGAAIGSGANGKADTITIGNGTITANGADGGAGAAGIGGGKGSSGGTITINGGTVNAAAGSGAYAVGSGAGAAGSDITITITTDGFREGADSALDVTLTGEGIEAGKLIEGGFNSKTLGNAHWAAVKLFHDSSIFQLFHNQKYTADYVMQNGLEDYDGAAHLWSEVERVEPSYTADGHIRYVCTIPDCKDEHVQILPKLKPEPTEHDDDSVGRPWLYVTDLEHVQVAYVETSEGGALRFSKDADEAILTGSFSALQEVADAGIEVVLFTTNQRTSSFRVADLLAQCSEGAGFELLHSGAEARLTISGQHAEGLIF